MSFVLRPWQILLVGLAGWISREQRQVIEYLITENQILKEKIGKKRILLNNDHGAGWLSKARFWDKRYWGRLPP